MEPKKDPNMVKKMFAQGELNMVDHRTGYRYSMVAVCPKTGDYSYVDRYEKSGKSLRSVTFKCPICSTTFEVPKVEILVI